MFETGSSHEALEVGQEQKQYMGVLSEIAEGLAALSHLSEHARI